jgi:hypothetical protein
MLAPDTVVIRLKQNQFRVFSSVERFVILVAGRRFGKTYLAVAKLIQTATSKAGSTSWYVAPTYKQAKMIAWKILKKHIPEEARSSCNEQELSIILKNGSEIALKGADNPDSLRGVALDLCVLDEFQDMDPTVWSSVIRPMLATTRGRAMFIGTPKGYNHFYDMYMAANAKAANWIAYHFTAYEGGYIPLDELLAAKNDPTITEREFRQEWEASFENLTGRVFESFSRLSPGGNIRAGEYAAGGTIYMGLDFNVNPMTASFAYKSGKEVQFFSEIGLRNSNTFEMVDATKGRFPGKHILCFPDPSGDSRSTKAQVGETDYTILRKAGFEVFTPGHPYNLADRINTTNGMLKNAAGVRRAFFDPVECKMLIKAFDGLCYKDGTKIPDKDSGLDHWTDNASYLLMGVAPMRSQGAHTQEFLV